MLLFLATGSMKSAGCPNGHLSADTTEQSFDIFEAGGSIPQDYQCTWVISGSEQNTIQFHIQLADVSLFVIFYIGSRVFLR